MIPCYKNPVMRDLTITFLKTYLHHRTKLLQMKRIIVLCFLLAVLQSATAQKISVFDETVVEKDNWEPAIPRPEQEKIATQKLKNLEVYKGRKPNIHKSTQIENEIIINQKTSKKNLTMKLTGFTSGLILFLIVTSCNPDDNNYKGTSTISEVTRLENTKLFGDENITTPYGEVTIEHNYITKGSDELFDAMDFQRACQAYIWTTPAVSYKQWQVAQAETFNAHNLGEFVVYNSLKEKRGIVTANLTTPYVINFLSLKDGAIEVNVPAGSMAGMFLDLWQRPVADIGLTGPDQGKGGSYIVVGPEEDKSKYKGKADFVIQSETNNIFIGIRVLDLSPEFVKKVREEMKVVRMGKPASPVTFIQGVDKEWSGTAPRGLEYWKLLNQILQEEPVREQDKVLMAMLEPLGLKKGMTFNPDERQQKILKEGAAMGELMLKNLQTNPRFAEHYWEGTNWYKSFDFTVPQITNYKVELDERAVWFYEAVTSSEGMVNPTPGKGQVYMTTKRDNIGNLLRADKTYVLHVPKDVPVAQFWSLSLYSENTRRNYDNGGTEIASASLDSKMKQLQFNEDGSIDLYIGAKAPEGKESNFMKTTGQDGWFVYFRLYAPTEPFFDKSYKLPDFEVVE